MAEGRRPELIQWLLHRLNFATFKQGPMRGKAQLVLQYELDLDNQNEVHQVLARGQSKWMLCRSKNMPDVQIVR